MTLGRIRHSWSIYTIVLYPTIMVRFIVFSELWWSDTGVTESDLIKFEFKFSQVDIISYFR